MRLLKKNCCIALICDTRPKNLKIYGRLFMKVFVFYQFLEEKMFNEYKHMY